MNTVIQATLLVSFPVLGATIGSIVAVVKPPGPRLISGIQHFAAGVVMAALVGEVLPGLRAEGNLFWAVTGFVLGTGVVLALGTYGRAKDSAGALPLQAGSVKKIADRQVQGPTLLPVGLLVAIGVDLLLDGLLVGLGVTLGSTQAIILTIALTIEILFIGLSLAAELTQAGMSKLRAALTCSGLSLATAVGAITGAALLGGASQSLLAGVLAFGAAALLYLAVEELLVEAHEQTETPLLAGMFFAGFLLIYILAELGG